MVGLDDDVFTEILERHLWTQAGAEVPGPVHPLLEFGVVGDPSFEGDGLIPGPTWELLRYEGIPALSVLDPITSVDEGLNWYSPIAQT